VRVICKGAPEVLLTPEFIADDVVMLRRAAGRAEELAGDGFRVLAVAAADLAGQPSGPDMERALRLLGLVAILDLARPSAAATIASCRAAGITPVLITGDHPATARAIARDLGIIGAGGRKSSTARRPRPGQRSARAGFSPAPPLSRSSPSSRLARRPATWSP
jgi:Ca2+-transporting ATPase